MKVPEKPAPSFSSSVPTTAAPSRINTGVVLAIVACIAALSLAVVLAVGIAVGGYFLSRVERARAQREAAEADRAVAAAFQDASIAISDAKTEFIDAKADRDRVFNQANEMLDRVETVVAAGNVNAAELRTWTRGEFTLEARFERLDGNDVILRKADGAEVSVPLSELSAVDQHIATRASPLAETRSTPQDR